MTHEDELIELLDKKTAKEPQDTDVLNRQREAIERTFKSFQLRGRITRSIIAPQVNCFDFICGDGEKPSLYRAFLNNIRLGLGSVNVRLVLPKSGGGEGRIEVPLEQRAMVSAGELFRSEEWKNAQGTLPMMLGMGLDGKPKVVDLAKAPHLLMAGSAGTGKTVFIEQCLLSLMLRHAPEELKLILSDSRCVEFTKYRNLPYLQFPVLTTAQETVTALQWLNEEMERRYELLNHENCRDIKAMNAKKPGALPFIVMVIDEFADFMLETRKLMESLLSRLCALSRAVGIHLIISTQRPDSRVLTGTIRANIPTRMAFRVADIPDSRKILDADDAECLLGLGDMLFKEPSSEELPRIQSGYVNDQESERIIERLKSMYGDMKPNALPPLLSTERNPMEILRDKLAYSARGILEDKLEWLKTDIIDEITRAKDTSSMEQLEANVEWCFNDSIIDEASDAVADSIIEHWDELKAVAFDVDEEPNRDEVEEADSESDEGLSTLDNER